ncbi:hypothetical protein VC83_02018 [Pseudogymnoascus destructans]|uniref:Uncharacterized protein n=1 Tax=Pseudogymnoascus destructans TaxID=655981 RepID=A0A177AJY7_9PEZI|nr:uncharacterized protein VC83_02018 [Pseudogymnoascus destructans]OAF61603.1 hypothetical protein VC83_02018 [Pseudogymnoascus destructans]
MPEYLNLASTTTGTTTAPSPEKSLTIYRHSKHRIFTFESSITEPAEYVIAASKSAPPPPRQQRLFPPESPSASSLSLIPIIGSLRFTSFWSKLTLELGDGVAQVEHNRSAKRLRRSEASKRKWRRWFGMKERPVKEMEEVEVLGLVLGVVMERRLRVGLGWSGTRGMARSWFRGVRGYSHDVKDADLMSLKLVRTSDHALIATYEKKHWGCSAGPGMDGKGKKRAIGTLRIYPAAYERPQSGTLEDLNGESTQGVRLAPKHRTGSNITGTHTGDIFEEAVQSNAGG